MNRKHVATGVPRGAHPRSIANLARGKRRGSTKLAPAAIARLRSRWNDADDKAELAAGFGITLRTAYRYFSEA